MKCCEYAPQAAGAVLKNNLNLLVEFLPEDNSLNVDGRNVDIIGIDVSDLDNFFDLDDGDPGSLAHRRVEILSRFPVQRRSGKF
jgi:hypothetical protein